MALKSSEALAQKRNKTKSVIILKINLELQLLLHTREELLPREHFCKDASDRPNVNSRRV